MKLKKTIGESAQEEAMASTGGAFISARHRNPAEELALQDSGASDKVGGVCAIIATLFLAAAAFLLYAQIGS